MDIGHSVGLGAGFLDFGVIVDKELLLAFEELVLVLLRRQAYLVGVLGQGFDEAAESLLRVLASHAQVLAVLEEHAKVLVQPEGRVRGQASQKDLVHLNSLFEHGQVFAVQTRSQNTIKIIPNRIKPAHCVYLSSSCFILVNSSLVIVLSPSVSF